MSYLALARKWRPRTFSQLVGQDPINKALINALNLQRLHHAYLFTGTRGVGKTSIARILAKSLSCEKGIGPEPCLECDSCTAIEQNRFIDLIEIDGASKTKVEDTRDLLDNVQYAPAYGRFKFYIIDEVHMLSQHSFNALLKTLEEPPAHVKFILATTDPQKLPVTVLSRCLQFHLKHIPTDLIAQHLQLILKEEQLNFEIPALNILAQAARGSMRDALSLLDQAIMSCGEKLCSADVKALLGYTQQDYALYLLNALTEQNAPLILTLSQQIANEGGHFHYVLDELLSYLHHIAIYQSIGDNNPIISPAPEIKALAQSISREDIQLFYQIGLKGGEELHLAPTIAIGFNMTLLRMLAFRPVPKVSTSSFVSSKTPTSQLKEPIPPNPSEDRFEAVQYEINSEAEPEIQPMSQILPDWTALIPHLKLTGLALNAAENAELIAREGNSVTLRVEKGYISLFTPTVFARIETSLGRYYQGKIKLILQSDEPVHASPAQKKERATQEKQKNAEQSLYNDPLFQQIQEEFSAELVKNSIVPLKDGI